MIVYSAGVEIVPYIPFSHLDTPREFEVAFVAYLIRLQPRVIDSID